MKYSKLKLAKELVKNRGFISKIPAMFRMLKAVIKGEFKMKKSNMIVSALIVAYILSPLDFLPDFIPFLGVFDDLGLLTILISKLMKETEDFLIFEEMKK